jgi:hypothetical protein
MPDLQRQLSQFFFMCGIYINDYMKVEWILEMRKGKKGGEMERKGGQFKER